MKIAVIQFPGSNCDQDCLRALTDGLRVSAEYLWHKERSVFGFDAVVLPGGFSYGDYLRCGAIARFSPIVKAIVRAANDGMPVIGICSGFQILCEAGLLPGALIRNQELHFVCDHVNVRVESRNTPFTHDLKPGSVLRMPIAHAEGNFVCDDATLAELQRDERIVFRYCDREGRITA